MKIILKKEIFTLALLISLFHFLALKLYLYWTVWWFDIPMHFIGGLLIGLITISLLSRIFVSDSLLDKKLLFISVIFGTMVVGLGWELWELFVGFTDLIKDKQDTILDLIMDFAGSIFAVLYYYFKYSK